MAEPTSTNKQAETFLILCRIAFPTITFDNEFFEQHTKICESLNEQFRLGAADFKEESQTSIALLEILHTVARHIEQVWQDNYQKKQIKTSKLYPMLGGVGMLLTIGKYLEQKEKVVQ